MIKKIVNITFYLFVLLNFCTFVLASSDADLSGIIPTLTEITRILLLIGGGVCIGKVIHIGILYVTTSAVDKSNAKMAIIPWLVGTLVCFGAATVGSFIINIIGGGDDGFRGMKVLEY